VSYSLLTQEITNLYRVPFFLDDTIDREMGIHRAHFIRESLRDTGDHVRDKTPDGPQTRHMLASPLPNSKSDPVSRLALEESNVHVDMTNVFCEGPARPCDGNEAGLNGNRDALRNVEFFGLEDVPHLVNEGIVEVAGEWSKFQISRAAPPHRLEPVVAKGFDLSPLNIGLKYVIKCMLSYHI